LRVSVITVCYNAAATIGDTLSSIAAQQDVEVEHIVVDGLSTDSTMDVVRKHPWQPSRVISERDAGLYYAMNKGINLATGDLVGFLNSDDVYADERVLADIAKTMADPAVDACYGDLVYVRHEDLTRVVRYWKSRDYVPGQVQRGWMPAHPTFYIRRRILQEVGGFDTRFRYQSDYELMVRLFCLRRIRTTYIPRVLVRMRMGGHTNRSLLNVARGNLEAYRACRVNGIQVSPLFIARKLASRVPQFFLRRIS
jgi:glycosyltransferase involved in cell wall biosynthesis